MASSVNYPQYAELHCLSNFTFLRGASDPEDLVERAHELNYESLAITDECSLSGVVRAHVKAKSLGFKLIIGSEFVFKEGLKIVLLVVNRESYGQLSRLITISRREAEKGEYYLDYALFKKNCPDQCLALWIPSKNEDELRFLKPLFPKRLWISVELHINGLDKNNLDTLKQIGEKQDLPLCAAGNVHMHIRERQILQDTITAIRLNESVSNLGKCLYKNAERYLRSRKKLQALYPTVLLHETLKISNLCHFSLDELRYEYPKEVVEEGYTAESWLTFLVESGVKKRWPNGATEKVLKLIQHELKMEKELS